MKPGKKTIGFFGKKEIIRPNYSDVKYATVSLLGTRENNEDSVAVAEAGKLKMFALADGLGGHGKGEVASALATDTAVSVFKQNANQDPMSILEMIFASCHYSILDEQERLMLVDAMRTTLTVLILSDRAACWAHIGDSRLYRFINGGYPERTTDHSVAQMLVASGEIKEKDIRKCPDRNRLLRVLGVDFGELRHEKCKRPIRARSNDSFLICSDGLWEPVTEDVMTDLLAKTSDPQHWLNAMCEEAQKRTSGKDMDNCSAIAITLI